VKRGCEWASSCLTAHQHISGHFLPWITSKIAENCRSQQPHCRLTSLPMEPTMNIRINLLSPESSHWPTLSKVNFGTKRKGVCDFLLVINSNFCLILHRFWDMATYWLKIEFFLPLYHFRVKRFKFLDEVFTAKSLAYLSVKISWS